MSDRQEMAATIEAILFVATEPVAPSRLLEVFDEKDRAMAQEALDEIVDRYREALDRGVLIDDAAGGLRLVTRPDLHSYLRRFFEISGSNKLSMAALETLAIIAYRQPVTSPEIQELRGVSSAGVIKTLLERRLVRIAGRKEVVGKPFLYTTTREFLMHFGLRTLKELPPLEQFEELYGGDGDGGLDLEPDGIAGDDHEEMVLRQVAEIEDAEDDASDRAEDDADDLRDLETNDESIDETNGETDDEAADETLADDTLADETLAEEDVAVSGSAADDAELVEVGAEAEAERG